MREAICADIETDGLRPNNIWVVGILSLDTDEWTAYTHADDNIAEGLMRLAEADLVVFHNGNDYDIPVIERLTDGLVKFDRSRVIDTLKMGRKLVPEMRSQKLEEWGKIFEQPKVLFEAWEKYDPEMVPRCKRDCEITKMVFNFLLELESQTISAQ
jgi:DNA polymerase III alpha subunit (gram-positive type)